MYSIFQDLSLRSIETGFGRFKLRFKLIKFDTEHLQNVSSQKVSGTKCFLTFNISTTKRFLLQIFSYLKFSKQNVSFTKRFLHNMFPATKRFLILHFHHKTFPASQLDATFHKKFYLLNVSFKKCFLSQNVSCRKMFPVTKCFLSQNVS